MTKQKNDTTQQKMLDTRQAIGDIEGMTATTTQETTMPTHTPGPWSVEYDGSVVMAHQVVSSAPGPDGSTREERLANARLIAAAPDLVAALASLLAVATRDRRKLGGRTDSPTFQAAKAALEKALGET